MIIPLLRRHAPCGMRSQAQQIAKNRLPVGGFTLSFPQVSLLSSPQISLLSFPPALSGNPEISKNQLPVVNLLT